MTEEIPLSSLETSSSPLSWPRATLAIMGKQIHLLDTRAAYLILPVFAGKPSSWPTVVTEGKGHVDTIHIPKQTVINAKDHQEMVVRTLRAIEKLTSVGVSVILTSFGETSHENQEDSSVQCDSGASAGSNFGSLGGLF